MNKIISRIFLALMFIMVVTVLMTGGMGASPDLSYAELAKERNETLSGVNVATANGNTTGAIAGVKAAESWAYSDEFTCMSFVTNVSGVIVANTATWTLEGSMDNSKWAVLQTTSIVDNEENLITNSSAGAFPWFRVNVGAIENANSYANVQCVFQ